MGNVTPQEQPAPEAAPYTLTPEDIGKILAANQKAREAVKHRTDRYTGEYQVRVGELKRNWDESRKTEVIDNKIGEMIDRHVGYALANGVRIESRGEDKTQVEFYNAVAEANDLDSLNIELYRDCFIANYGVEVHSFDPEREGAERIRITHTPPIQWALVWDTDNILRAAIRCYDIGPYVFRDGKLIDQESRVSVYTDASTQHYKSKSVSGQVPTLEPDGEAIENHYGTIPVAWFSITEDFTNYISTPMEMLQDHYNELLSDNGNAVKLSSGSLLIVKGYANTDENKQEAAEAKKQGVMLLATDGGAESLTVGVPETRISWQEERIRSALYAAGKMTDTARVIGATGQLSGTVLELLSMPQRDFALTAIQYFAEGIRRRIALINAITAHFSGAGFVQIEDYEVNIEPSIARVVQEAINAMGPLADTLSTIDRIRMLPWIKDPEEALKRLEDERNAGQINTASVNALANPEQAVTQNDARVAAGVPDMGANVQQLLDALIKAAESNVIKSGAIERIAAQRATAKPPRA